MTMQTIRKARRERFGGIFYSENPGFMAYVDNETADSLGLAAREDLPPELLSAPLDVHLSVTTRCNRRCSGCYAVGPATPRKDMPLPLAKRIVDNLARLQVFTVAMGGGEPLVYPHVFELAHYIRKKHMVPNITTNGALIDVAAARECRVFGNVHLSSHGASDLACLEAPFRSLQEYGIVPGLNFLVSRETFAQIPRVFAWCARHRIPKVLLLKYKVTVNNATFTDRLLSPRQEYDFYPLLRRAARRYNVMPMIDCSFFPTIALHRPSERDLRFFDVNGCQGGRMYLAVDTEGRCKPCSFCTVHLGAAEDLTPATWQTDPVLTRFREEPALALCRECPYLELCNGGCRQMRNQPCAMNGALAAPPARSA
ncbi:MAG: radical SAM protein [Kiritimatiellae bacterium]|nr:radical SAM protein [Kiritimatiellia bacterium]